MKITVFVMALKFILLIECKKLSPGTYTKQSKSKPDCSAGNNKHHAEFCDVYDPLITSSSKPNKRDENVKLMQKSNTPSSDNFICEEQGFFPGR